MIGRAQRFRLGVRCLLVWSEGSGRSAPTLLEQLSCSQSSPAYCFALLEPKLGYRTSLVNRLGGRRHFCWLCMLGLYNSESLLVLGGRAPVVREAWQAWSNVHTA